ncbi:uncharacterized protein LOC130813082 isoform X2 [Amaranthus tricolor]|nr:uncharacterized protein LOC130813082 isoform X2 [Amaranthus tricolor]
MEEKQINKKRKTEVIKNNNGGLTRKIKLYCPAASKIAEIIAWEDQKLDLGTIAKSFSLEPATLKLNGHFISRGMDLIASSVTWKSLLSFFSSKGLSTGTDSSGALVVDGKLSKSGTKRAHEQASEVLNRVNCVTLQQEYPQSNPAQAFENEDINSPKNKKMKDIKDVCINDSKTIECSTTGTKRKNWLGNISPYIKRVRVNEGCSDKRCQ